MFVQFCDRPEFLLNAGERLRETDDIAKKKATELASTLGLTAPLALSKRYQDTICIR